jgi:hypothetical protein
VAQGYTAARHRLLERAEHLDGSTGRDPQLRREVGHALEPRLDQTAAGRPQARQRAAQRLGIEPALASLEPAAPARPQPRLQHEAEPQLDRPARDLRLDPTPDGVGRTELFRRERERGVGELRGQ